VVIVKVGASEATPTRPVGNLNAFILEEARVMGDVAGGQG
jgi:hypothetical protein